MQTKLGKVSCAKELTCFTDMFFVEQSVFINDMPHMYHEKNVARNFVTIFHIKSVVQNSNIHNSHACLEAFITTKLNQRFYGTE
jgi:hypothetical protein